ncbi:MAG: hypothetical protein R3C60_01940 [Parvularculaceae bacterium]
MRPNVPPAGKQSDFDFLIGKWRVKHHTLRGRLTGATKWDVADAIDIVSPAFGGMGNIGQFMRLIDNEPYVGMPIRLFDPGAMFWRIYWLDTRDQRMEPPIIGGFDGDVGLFFGDDILRGEPIRIRFLWKDITDLSARWEQAFSPDGGASWEVNSVMEFIRDDTLPDHPQFPISTCQEIHHG